MDGSIITGEGATNARSTRTYKPNHTTSHRTETAARLTQTAARLNTHLLQQEAAVARRQRVVVRLGCLLLPLHPPLDHGPVLQLDGEAPEDRLGVQGEAVDGLDARLGVLRVVEALLEGDLFNLI